MEKGSISRESRVEGCWPREWMRRIEYRERLAMLADALSK